MRERVSRVWTCNDGLHDRLQSLDRWDYADLTEIDIYEVTRELDGGLLAGMIPQKWFNQHFCALLVGNGYPLEAAHSNVHG